MTYKFKGKALFYLAGFICLISVVLSPFGLLFIYMGATAYLRLEDNRMIYKMLTKKEIPYSEIAKIKLSRPVDARYKIGYAFVSFASVIPLIIEQKNGKKIKISLNYFQDAQQIAETLEQKTGLKIELPE